jgi:hypothetical protein
MELFLNLAWLLLVLPAYWLWRRSRHGQRKFTSAQCLLALACVLVLLFPVISATDDVHVMRAEIEESPVLKRTLRQATVDNASPWTVRLQSPPAVLAALISFTFSVEFHELAPAPVPYASPTFVLHVGRAPPVARLA